MRRVLDVLADALMAAAWCLLVWRMGVAMLDYRENAEVTFILQFPVWWGYAASMVPAVVGCLVYFWRLLETLGADDAACRFRNLRGGALMDALTLAAWSFPVLLVLIFLRLPIGLAMLVIGLAGSWQVYGSASPLLNQMKTLAYGTFSTHSLSIVPLFLLMGQFATLGGMSQALFKAAEAFLGHRKGGVGMAAIGACAGFGSICGSSMATAATMGQVALPELKRAGYSGALSSGRWPPAARWAS
jgi:hypothetical protein